VTAKAPSFAFDVAISATDYDTRVLRELERQVALRLHAALPMRSVWTNADSEVLGAPRSAVFSRTARVAVVLHQHLWGKDEVTKDDGAAIKRRIAAKGPESVRVVLLDSAVPPVWLRKSPSQAFGEGEITRCADWIADAVGEAGGSARPATMDAAIDPEPVDERVTKQRDAFLASHRAIAHLGREFDRLAGAVERRVATVNRDEVETPLEVHRVPGRCTVQLGPVALTLSWVRTRPDTVATGRLMIIEWEGRVGGRGAVGSGPSAVPLRETVLRADATRVEDWQWRSDEVVGYAYDSDELAAHCVDSLAYALQDRARSGAA
jgi:hypothetical protein